MNYEPLKIERPLRVGRLYSLHYFQFAAGYIFPGESHDFWEMVYIDRGEADIGAGEEIVRLREGQVFFHRPGEFHTILAGATGPNIMVLSFDGALSPLRPLAHRVLPVSAPEKTLLRQIIQEGEACFGPVLDISDQHRLVPLEGAPFAACQLIETYLTQLLILLVRGDSHAQTRTNALKSAPQPLTGEEDAAALTLRLAALMREHPDGSLTFEALCRHSGLCATALKSVFRRVNGMGVMEYYRRLRLEEARRLLRDGRYNVTQTAEKLGYSSVNAFSRQFRALLGVTPTGYLKSVRK